MRSSISNSVTLRVETLFSESKYLRSRYPREVLAAQTSSPLRGEVLQRIKDLGGNLQWVFFDNPLFYGSYYSGENACQLPLSAVLTNLLSQLPIIKSIFPNVRIGDIEGIAPPNVPDWLDRLKSFVDMYRQATGSNFAALRVDTGGFQGDWRDNLIAFSQLAAQEGIPFGIIYQGTNQGSRSLTA